MNKKDTKTLMEAYEDLYKPRKADDVGFETNYHLGMQEHECEDGNIVNDAFNQLSFPKYQAWVQDNWDKMSDYEQSVAENIEYNVRDMGVRD